MAEGESPKWDERLKPIPSPTRSKLRDDDSCRIVLCDKNSQRPLVVLDTKYKMSEQPTEADIYQVAFYARELGVQRAILVYPSPLRVPLSMRHSWNIAIEALTFDVTKPLSVAGPAFIASLC